MTLTKYLTELDAIYEADPLGQWQGHRAAAIVGEVSSLMARAGHGELVRAPVPDVDVNAAKCYVAHCIAAISEKSEPDALIDLATAAELLGYKPAGLRKVVKAGQIRFVQNGNGPIKFRREWLDEYLQANNPTGVKRSPSQRRVPPPTSTVPGFDPSRFKR
ncbi:helix-turn-helix domain-containing protein [Lacipirellula parvula]|uniref:Helix-turn-helix domain-containing protein n=1 Tax=Lacipirellula parvula TaxID=2650471 RepID=A0A5K7XHR4_9BACT|nr:helix-turn-helix domain-containing protein [Lacipirellula parvula]BBO35527.1 hypothetical protein PLANPX_5139 [Lacipirellula parvula]